MSDIFKERQAFNFYRSYYDTSLLLDTENRTEFLDSILHYQFTGEIKEPSKPMALLAFRGQIHSLKKQVIGFQRGKETYPNGNPTKGLDKGKHKGSHKEVQEKVQVQEEEKGKEEKILTPTAFSFYKSLISIGAESKLANEWLAVRKKKKATDTETAFDGFVREMNKGGLDINSTLRICIEKSWSGLNAKWLDGLKVESKPLQGESLEDKARREYIESFKNIKVH